MTDLFEFLSKKSLDVLAVKDDKEAQQAYKTALYFDGLQSFVLPDLRADFLEDLRSFYDEILELNAALCAYYECKGKKLLIAPINTLCKYLPAPKALEAGLIKKGADLDIAALKQELLFKGYNLSSAVMQMGEASFRGDIIDIFPPGESSPFRINLFDTQVESIQRFDEETQRTQKQEEDLVKITPALFSLNAAQYESLQDLIAASGADLISKDVLSLGFWFLKDLGLADNLCAGKVCYACAGVASELDLIYDFNKTGFIAREDLNFAPLPPATKYKSIDASDPATLIEFHKDKKIKLLAASPLLLQKFGIAGGGFEFIQTPAIINAIAPGELILSLNKPQKKRRVKKTTLGLDDLKQGDFVVHENYGIGVFSGLEQVKIMGGLRDFIAIMYQAGDKLLLPVENLHLIDRYVAASNTVPVIDKLGKSSFVKLKEKTKQRLLIIAAEIIKRAAFRELARAPALEIPSGIKSFQKSSGFAYTSDQEKAINDIFADFQKGLVMDRLLSADVGFGKTEVAMNAIFTCVANGLLSVFAVPTTLLCAQHYATLRARFEPLGIKVYKYDRFTSSADKAKIKKGLAAKDVKILVGTHSVLGLDLSALGLVVIDEEHKFGVKQKESLKDKSKGVHVLSMSATPIPRSLNLALSRIKSFSKILTPPPNRQDVRTFVKESSDALIKEAITRELRRGGQVFYVHNRIASLEQKAAYLKGLIKNLRILILHSQIDSQSQERQMLDFLDKKYDVLLCTSIISAGIHIPNVNTIMIDGSDMFGLADLHQLRGRVGRQARQGFCFFLVNDKDAITPEAKKRLLALEQNSFLGSGANIAYQDLEIRGGGNILGAEQSGQIKHIGYSLYLKLLEEAINELSKEQSAPGVAVQADIKLAVSAYISSELVSEDSLRIDLYRRFSSCANTQEIYELALEMEDRFGKLDTPSKQFVDLMAIKIAAGKKGIKSISSFGRKIVFVFASEQKQSFEAASKDDDDVIAATAKALRD